MGRPDILPSGTDPKNILGLEIVGPTAYFGMFKISGWTPKDKTMVVSGAAGATGLLVIQIAKHVLGIEKVYGIAGGPEKCKLVESLGANKCYDYKSAGWEEEFTQEMWNKRGGIESMF